MGIKKVRLYECDTRGCESVVFDAFDRMPKGWGWRHVIYRDDKKVKIRPCWKGTPMYLFCGLCMEKEEIDVPGF